MKKRHQWSQDPPRMETYSRGIISKLDINSKGNVSKKVSVWKQKTCVCGGGISQSFNNRFQTVLCMKHQCNNSPTNQYQRFLCQVTISICHSTKMPLISFYEEFASVAVFLCSSVTATKHNILFSFRLLSLFFEQTALLYKPLHRYKLCLLLCILRWSG